MKPRWNQLLRREALSLATLVIMSLAIGGLAQAELVTFRFAGVIDAFHPSLNPPIGQDTPITGSYNFESTLRDREPGDPFYASYGPLASFSLEFLGNQYSLNPNDLRSGIVILHIPPAPIFNEYHLYADLLPGNQINGLNLNSFLISLRGEDLFHDTSLPLTPPSLSGFDLNMFHMAFYPPGSERDQAQLAGAGGRLTSLTLDPVPLPGTLLLFGSGLLGLAGFGYRRRMVTRIQQ